MGLREVKTELKKLDKDELIKHLSELYKRYKPVKEYLDFHVFPDEAALLEKYKAKVREGVFPKGIYALKLSISRQAISDFKKLGTSRESVADLLLYYVECAVELINDIGEIDEKFYRTMERHFAESLEIMYKEGVLDKYQERAYNVMCDADGVVGWFFPENLEFIYYDYYE